MGAIKIHKKEGAIFKNRKSNLFSIMAVLVTAFSLVVGAVSLNNSINQTINETLITNNSISEKRVLAKVFNEDNLDFDRAYRLKYLQKRNNFSHVTFKNITEKENFILKVGAKRDKIRGININDKNFVIDLIDCDSWERYCAFRINGVPTKKLFAFDEFEISRKNSFDLDTNYIMKVNSVKFDFCDNRRFCHLGYEGYDIVDVSVEKK